MKIAVTVKEAMRYISELPEKIHANLAKEVERVAKNIQIAQAANITTNLIKRQSWGEHELKIKTSQGVTSVLSTAPFLPIHETGGEKIGLQYVPFMIRKNIRDIIPKEDRPQNLRKAFFLRTKQGKTFLVQRKGSELLFQYVFVSSVKIRKRLQFYATAREEFSKQKINLLDNKIA